LTLSEDINVKKSIAPRYGNNIRDYHLMITCNKCGRKNNNAAKTCSKCGHKLQSGRNRSERNTVRQERSDMFHLKLERGKLFSKHGEAWVYSLFLLGAVIFFTYNQIYWPLYAL